MEGRVRSYDGELENLEATELRLGLPGSTELIDETKRPARGIKRALKEMGSDQAAAGRPAAKAQVVGWPPVRSYRKNAVVLVQQAKQTDQAEGTGGGSFVKVSMDGAPYLRKIDVKMYKGYKELREALDNLFKCFSNNYVGELSELGPAVDYAIAYEDKDGDWMLAGDVPWGMFTSSCKRLRIMRGSDARGLAPNT